MEDDKKKVAVVGEGNVLGAAEALSALASMVSVPSFTLPTPIFSGKSSGKPQKMGTPTLSGRRLQRLKKQCSGR